MPVEMIRIFRLLTLERTVMISVFVVLLAGASVLDPDFYWHIKTGEYILSTQSLPGTDPFSFTNQGRPWNLHEWLSQIILYLVFDRLGEPGIIFFSVFLFTAAFLLIYRLLDTLLEDRVRSMLLCVPFLVFSLPSLAPRPQLFTFLFLALFIYTVFQLIYFRKTRLLIALPPVMLLWVNMHAGYIIGVALLMAVLFLESFSYLAKREQDARRRDTLIRLGKTTAVVIAVTLVNPYTYHQWLYPLAVLDMEVTKKFITEWQAPDFHSNFYRAYLFTVIAFAAIMAWSRTRPSAAEFIVPFLFIALSITSARNVPLACIVMLPYLARFLGFTPFYAWLTAPAARGMADDPARPVRPPNAARANLLIAFNWAALPVLLASFLAYAPTRLAAGEERLEKHLPVRATDFVLEHGIKGRVFHTFHYGGYLLYRLFPDQQVFIDGRADMYGDDFILEYMKIFNGSHGWKELFDKYDIDYVITEIDAPIRQLLLEGNSFDLAYADAYHSVLVRKTAKTVDPAQPEGREGR
jgi:hypothetical protein